MKKVNLGKKPITKWKKFLLYLSWITHDKNDRKTWEEVKHGAIKHECKFEGEITIYQGYRFHECIHYGCNIVNPLDY